MSKTICLNGLLKVGDLVMSTPTSDYPCLVGVVTKINPVGSSEHDEETENHTDDVWVNFDNDYSEARQAEILEAIRDLYDDDAKPYDDICWDIIMPPGELIRVDETATGNPAFFNNILDKESVASMYAFIELYRVAAQPSEVTYSVTRYEQTGGKVSRKVEHYPMLHTAWEVACDYYAELREQYRDSTVGWRDVSSREDGIFIGQADDGDYFKVYIQEHGRGESEPFNFPEA